MLPKEKIMKKKVLLFAIFSVMSSLAFADSCKPEAFLKDGVNFDALQQCKSALRQCPRVGPFPDQHCVSEQMKSNNSCAQFANLSSLTGNNASFTNVNKVKNFTLVQNYAPADGQSRYFAIDSQGCLISATIEQQKIDPAFAQDNSKRTMITVALTKPIIHQDPSGQSVMTVRLAVRECLACKTLKQTTANFMFDSSGKYQGVKLQD